VSGGVALPHPRGGTAALGASQNSWLVSS
jgi:hypothetical protein